MGKKKVARETTEEALKQSEATEAAVQKAGQKMVAKRYERGRVYIATSYNNTVVTITDDRGNAVAWSSAGTLGFSGPKKATPFAASKIVAALHEKVQKSGPFAVDVLVRGVGGGRDSAIRSLINRGWNVLSIKDVTPIPHNGPRPRKVRRV